MGTYKEIEGNLITLAQQGNFDVVIQGNNCFCIQGAGLAPQFVKAFGSDKFWMERPEYKGDYNKMGQIDFMWVNPLNKEEQDNIRNKTCTLAVVNCYSQYDVGSKNKNEIPLDYDALRLCLRKINKYFKGLRIGVPQIGCGLAGGDWNVVSTIIQEELKNCEAIVVIYNPPAPPEFDRYAYLTGSIA